MIDYDIFSMFYDTLTDNVDYDSRAAFIHQILSEHNINDGILLDLACGTGSLSVRMSTFGYDVIGVDISPGMLSEAQQKAFEAQQQILFLCQPMQELDLYGTVVATICALDSLNHLSNIEDVEKVFQRVALFTEPGGLFIFDVNTPYKHEEILADNTFVFETDDVYCVWQNDKLPDSVEQITLDFFEKDADVYYRSREQFLEKAYSISLLTDLLIRNGFAVKAVYDEMSYTPLSDTTQRAVFIAEKL